MDEDKSVLRCMVKRSKLTLKMFWVVMKCGIVYIILAFAAMMISLYVNLAILMYCLGLIGVGDTTLPGWVLTLVALVVFFGAFLEIGLVCACASCIPVIQRVGKKIIKWIDIDTLMPKKKEEPLMVEV